MIKRLLSIEEEPDDHPLLQQYGSRCEWLKDDKFLRDLEGDSVDTEILDEELRSLQEDEPKTCRGKTVKFLESNPFQIVLCVLVLVDAGVVIAEILLDLHAIRGQYREATDDLLRVLSFLKVTYADELDGYTGTNMQYILDKLRRKYNSNETEPKTRNRRAVPQIWPPVGYSNLLDMQLVSEDELEELMELDSSGVYGGSTFFILIPEEIVQHPPDTVLRGNSSDTIHNTDMNNSTLDSAHSDSDTTTFSRNMQYVSEEGDDDDETVDQMDMNNNINVKQSGYSNHIRLKRDVHDPYRDEREIKENSTPTVAPTLQDNAPNNASNTTLKKASKRPVKYKTKGYSYAQKLLKIAHILHYCSIAILGIFVIQLLFKIYAMGAEFFRKKMEIFDGVIILASFALDLVFLEGIVGVQGEEAAALLVMFLLWRILRVINGILVTAKKRQEFRIKLQKRARRRAEKKIELLEEEKQLKEKEICALRDLCQSKGAAETEVTACKPRRRSIFQKMDTSAGLSSIAALSLGFSMSMSGGGASMFNNQSSSPSSNQAASNPVLNSRKDSVADIMTLPPRLRRQSLAALPMQQMREKSPLKITVRPSSMERVLEESSPEDESKQPAPAPLKNGRPASPNVRSIEGGSPPGSMPTTSLLPPGSTGKQVTFELEVDKPSKHRSHESVLAAGKTIHPKKSTLVNNGPLSNTDLSSIGRSVSDRAINRLSPPPSASQQQVARRSSDSSALLTIPDASQDDRQRAYSGQTQCSTESEHGIANHIEGPSSTRI